MTTSVSGRCSETQSPILTRGVHLQELKLVFPGAQRMNRGRHEVGALVRACKANGVTDLLVVHEHRGTPGKAGGRELGAARVAG